MVKMGTVWDRTTAVLEGRSGLLASIATVTMFLPSVARAAYSLFVSPTSVAAAVLGLVAMLAVFLVMILGQLAIVAVASDPATTRADAYAQARDRLGPALGVTLVLAVIGMLLLAPAAVALLNAGIDWNAVAAGTPPTATAPSGALVFASFYSLAFAVAVIAVGARLVPLNPIVLEERRGLGAIRRSWALTRGHGWRLVGALLLWGIMTGIATSAARLVVGLVARLLLGPEALAPVAFVAVVAAAAVQTVFTVIFAVFSAQLYVALVARQPADA